MKFVELGICCEIINGSTPSRIIPEYWGGDINWFTPKDLSNLQGKFINESPEKINPKGYSSCSTSMLPANSLLYTSRAPIGHIAINKIECCTNQGFKSLIPKKGVDVNYLYYTLKQFTPQLQNLGNGATFKELSKATMSEFQIPLPPLETQQKIAAILDAADTLRQKDKALVAKYDELTQALFLDMFGDPVKNEKGWEFKVLNELIIQKPDNGFFAKSNFYTNEGVQIVWLSDFIDRIYIKTAKLKRVLTSEKDKKYILKYGDALFCRSSLTVVGIGKCAIVPKNIDEPIIFECHIIRLRLEINTILPEFFRFLTNTKYFRNEVMKNAKTSTMTTISQEGISCIKIPIPPFDLQTQFAERLAIIEQQKALAQASLEKSEELFNSLLQKAFKGELV
jgi:type I restriction enzyme S subunit